MESLAKLFATSLAVVNMIVPGAKIPQVLDVTIINNTVTSTQSVDIREYTEVKNARLKVIEERKQAFDAPKEERQQAKNDLEARRLE